MHPVRARRPSPAVLLAAPLFGCGVLLSTSLLVGCAAPNGPAASDAAAAQPIAAPAPPAPTGNRDCWFLDRAAGALVAVWVSPRLEGEVPGGFRFVNLIHHDAEGRGAVILHSRPARCDSDEAVAVGSGRRRMRARPAGGRTWREVVDARDLDVSFDRDVAPRAAPARREDSPGFGSGPGGR